jgi:starch phosphorylase
MAELFDQYLGTGWRAEPDNPEIWQRVHEIPDEELWEVREALRGELVRFARRRIKAQLQRRGSSQTELMAIESILDPRILTIGFARRFATYKRATLMLSDRERLKSLFFHSERPIQIVVAGKSHPRDDGGKSLIQDIYRFINIEGAGHRMVFLEDYDMNVARHMVQGVDVWLNNPRRPHEASGTSGMKVVPNGGLNCSILDGWWDEGFSPNVGWAIGDRRDYPESSQQDWLDSHSLYHLIESEIAPKFYHRMNGSAPEAWVHMIKSSIADLAPAFSTSRMVADYCRKSYLPAWKAFGGLAVPGVERAKAALAWRDRVRAEFPKVAIRSVSHTAKPINRLEDAIEVKAYVDHGGLTPEELKVQVVFGQVGPGRELLNCEAIDLAYSGQDGEFLGKIALAKSGQRGFSVRVVPFHPDVVIPGELNLVRWEGN